jgi:hypothetical protein
LIIFLYTLEVLINLGERIKLPVFVFFPPNPAIKWRVSSYYRGIALLQLVVSFLLVKLKFYLTLYTIELWFVHTDSPTGTTSGSDGFPISYFSSIMEPPLTCFILNSLTILSNLRDYQYFIDVWPLYSVPMS